MKFHSGILILIFLGIAFAQPPDVDTRYHTYQEVLDELETITSSYPTICLMETLGVSTTDSVPIIGVKVSADVSFSENKISVLIIAGQHAREVQGPEVVMWLINYLVENYGSDTQVTQWLDSLLIYFIPVNNPEGHNVVMQESSFHTTFWRKTKRDNNHNGVFDTLYDGVDPNRNYEFLWDEYTDSIGVSPESEYYKGPYPWSENEVVVVRNLVDSLRPSVVLDLHSPDSIKGNKLWFCWYDPELSTYHQEGFPHYLNVANQLADNTETEIDGEYYESTPAYNTKPKLQLWTYWYSGCCAILMEITNQCYWTGEIIDTISARVGRGIFYIFDRMLESGLVVKAFDSESGNPLRAEIIVEEVTDTTFPPRLCNYEGIYHRLLYNGTYNVIVRYDTLEQIFEDLPIESGHNTYLEVDFPGAKINTTIRSKNEVDILLLPSKAVCIAPKGKVEIFDIAGKTVYRNMFKNHLEIRRDRLPAGVYFIKLSSGSETIKRKFIGLK